MNIHLRTIVLVVFKYTFDTKAVNAQNGARVHVSILQLSFENFQNSFPHVERDRVGCMWNASFELLNCFRFVGIDYVLQTRPQKKSRRMRSGDFGANLQERSCWCPFREIPHWAKQSQDQTYGMKLHLAETKHDECSLCWLRDLSWSYSVFLNNLLWIH